MKAVIGDLERMKIEGAAQVQRAEKIAMETEQLNLQQTVSSISIYIAPS